MPTVAVPGAALLHVPPGVISASEAVAPTQIFTGPAGVIAAGVALTVTGAPTAQVPIVYDTEVVPAATPVTTPAAIVAIAGVTLLQVPPPTLSVNVDVVPGHTVTLAGDKAAGVTRTVTDFIAEQPSAEVYKMLTVPAATPVTVPEVPTVAVPGAALLQVPPGVKSPNEAVPPTHIVTAPGGVIAAGLALTVTGAPTAHVPKV